MAIRRLTCSRTLLRIFRRRRLREVIAARDWCAARTDGRHVYLCVFANGLITSEYHAKSAQNFQKSVQGPLGVRVYYTSATHDAVYKPRRSSFPQPSTPNLADVTSRRVSAPAQGPTSRRDGVIDRG